MPDQRRLSVLVMAILALLGLASVPQLLKSPDSDDKKATGGEVRAPSVSTAAPEADESSKDGPHVRDLKPLLEYLGDGRQLPVDDEKLENYFRKRLCQTKVYSLIITLPDPVESVASGRFDECLDVVQRAIELQGFILDRTILPWKAASSEPNTPPDTSTKVKLPRGPALLEVETTATPIPERERPGLLVFKQLIAPPSANLALSDPPSSSPPPRSVILAFIVPESPISGIQKTALVTGLDLIDQFLSQTLTHQGSPPAKDKEVSISLTQRKKAGKPVLHIIAPCFNGSQSSLEVALAGWRSTKCEAYHFRVIAPSAYVIDKSRLEDRFKTLPNKLTFHSMVHKIPSLRDTLLSYLCANLGYHHNQIAVLVESNSGLAQALVREREKQRVRKGRTKLAAADPQNSAEHPTGDSSPDDEMSLVEFLYPLQVGELRKSYENAGLLSDKGLGSDSNPMRLPVPSNEGGTPRDVARSFTPATSAALDEMALTQVLTTIARRPYQAVGVFATDPADVVFLARQVRRFCPNVRLFTTCADLLLTHPGQDVDLRGMLVASTYPLYPSNQWMTIPHGDGPRVFFGNRGSQGLYNATVAHLWEMGADEPKNGDQSAPQLLEFRLPYDLHGHGPDHPPVWISVVGERGLYPVSFTDRNDDPSYLYDPSTAPEQRPHLKAGNRPPNVTRAAAMASSPSPHLFFWLITLSLFFACAAVAMTTWNYVNWSLDERKLEPKKRGLMSARRLLRSLNCEVAEYVPLQLQLESEGEPAMPTQLKPRSTVVVKKGPNGQWSFQIFDGKGRIAFPPPADLTEVGADNSSVPEAVIVQSHLQLLEHVTPGKQLSDEDRRKLIDAAVKITGHSREDWEHLDPRTGTPVALKAFRPDRYDPRTHPFPPHVGAGANIAVLNLVVASLTWYVYIHLLVAISPLAIHRFRVFVPLAFAMLALALISASTAVAVLELLAERPGDSTRGTSHHKHISWWEWLIPRRVIPPDRSRWLTAPIAVAAVAVAMAVVMATIAAGCAWGWAPDAHPSVALWRLSFERFTSVPSGVSPLFPVLFLGLACAAGVYFQLALRRLYLQSYLPSDIAGNDVRKATSHFDRILISVRKARSDFDELISSLWHSLAESSLWLRLACGFLVSHMIIRCIAHGIPGSLETRWFDRVFWLLFAIIFTHVAARALELTAVWSGVRKMLGLAVQLPLSHAYDRVPARYTGWFFGEDDFRVREDLIAQQSEAVRLRCSDELADILHEIEKLSTDGHGHSWFRCKLTSQSRAASPAGAREQADEKKHKVSRAAQPRTPWHAALAIMRESLEDSSALDSMRTVYQVLGPMWDSFPVEEMAKLADAGGKGTEGVDWLESWPLTPLQREKLKSPKKLAIVRDWARMAEDLVALQIVRSFAPALSHLVPMMQSAVIGSLCLLLAAMSYPFDHQGWLTVMMVCLIIFVGGVVTMILVGINRDELISRVSDTAPGRMTFDSNFLTSVVTMLGPLLGALLAMSFDLGDVLRAWLGPLLMFV